jgi:predicted protein tyrosine phosphatase
MTKVAFVISASLILVARVLIGQESLSRDGDDATFAAEINRGLSSADSGSVNAALYGLMAGSAPFDASDSTLVDALVACTGSADPTICANAVFVLTRALYAGDEPSEELAIKIKRAMLSGLESERDDVKEAALAGLARLGPNAGDCLAEVELLAKSGSDRVRGKALACLAIIAPNEESVAKLFLEALTRSENSALWLAAMRSAHYVKVSLNEIQHALADTVRVADEPWSLEAAEAIERQLTAGVPASPETKELLVHVVAGRNQPPAIRVRAAAVVGRFLDRDPAAVELLLDVLSDEGESESMRITVLQAFELMRTAPARVIERVQQLTTARSEELRTQAGLTMKVLARSQSQEP